MERDKCEQQPGRSWNEPRHLIAADNRASVRVSETANYAMRTASQNSAPELLAISSIASKEPICAAPQPGETV
jgi:hypothetical protein